MCSAELKPAVLAGLILLPTDTLIVRFGEMAGVSGLSADTRAAVRCDTGRRVGVYPLFACGLDASIRTGGGFLMYFRGRMFGRSA